MVDTHAHLDFVQYDNDRDQIISECRANGVKAIVNIGVDLETSRAGIALAEKHDFIYATVGYHPHEAKHLDDNIFAEIKKLARHPKVVAIGEIGLDYYRNLSPAEAQLKAFAKQLDLADELNLPVVFHIRQALAQTFDILDKRDRHQGILHAFPGDGAEAAHGIEMGYFIAFGGPITYPKSRGPQVAASIPISRLVTETDCPYLPPQQFRGKRNRPDYIRYVIEKLSEVHFRYSYDDIERISEYNAARVLNLKIVDQPKLAYKIGRSLYINLTARCTNNCYFCPKNTGCHVAGHNLLLSSEPTEAQLLEAFRGQDDYDEIVFCGLGEPTLRAELLLSLAGKFKAMKVPLRLNTNGQGSYITRTDLPPKLAGLIDIVNVSLNAADAATYELICRPQFGQSIYGEVIRFAERCRDSGLQTVLSVVDVPEIDKDECEKVAARLRLPLKIREYALP